MIWRGFDFVLFVTVATEIFPDKQRHLWKYPVMDLLANYLISMESTVITKVHSCTHKSSIRLAVFRLPPKDEALVHHCLLPLLVLSVTTYLNSCESFEVYASQLTSCQTRTEARYAQTWSGSDARTGAFTYSRI